MNRKILSTLSYGMYAIGVKGENKPSACIANTVFQICSSPITVAVSISIDNYTNKCIKDTSLFTVSVLSEDTSGAIIGALGFNSGRNTNKLLNIKHKILDEGLPVLKEHSCCWFLCKVTNSIEINTHTLFIAEVIAGSDKCRALPMTYSYYQNTIKGTAPKNAPTYQYIETNEESEAKYTCKICGYVYTNSNEPFESLPEDWVCPVCGAPKSVFKIN